MPLFSKKITPTQITAKIEKATSVEELDWTIVFQLCDLVNSSETGAKEARKLLQKKLLASDPRIQYTSLEILNALAENSTAKFQSQLGAKSFGEELYTLVSTRVLEDRVHGKLAQCLGQWIEQTKGEYSSLKRAYDILMNGTALQGNKKVQVNRTSSSVRPKARDVKEDIELAKNSAQLFSQTLSFTDPTKEDISKNELIQEFYNKCKHSQALIASHLENTEDPEIISLLINTNNELLSGFKSYDEMIEQRVVNDAIDNSKSLHYRNTRNENETFNSTEGSSSHPVIQQEQPVYYQSNNPFQVTQQQSTLSNDPFDPFADSNQVSSSIPTLSTNQTTLPPPLTPQRMHE